MPAPRPTLTLAPPKRYPEPKLVLGRIRVKRGIGRVHALQKVEVPAKTKRQTLEENLPDGVLMVKVPHETAETINAIAKYEERSRSTVLRSLVLLGLRVYRQLSEDISPYPPAHIDVSQDEIREVAAAIEAESEAARVAFTSARCVEVGPGYGPGLV